MEKCRDCFDAVKDGDQYIPNHGSQRCIDCLKAAKLAEMKTRKEKAKKEAEDDPVARIERIRQEALKERLGWKD